MLSNSLLNFLGRPHFIAYNLGKRPFGTRFSEFMGAMNITWTNRKKEDESNDDGIIFENYEPDRFIK